ncbi:hypothetical protein L6452_09704 [Arctium lappa]|uniref:Uncharacterized protein n=1 Tax=Arctium lappa TaxID=4217 RepID=A0ACB9DLY6_ARCLA|nr:hypothetical protein L6452_09704 [Arctium lappa]
MFKSIEEEYVSEHADKSVMNQSEMDYNYTGNAKLSLSRYGGGHVLFSIGLPSLPLGAVVGRAWDGSKNGPSVADHPKRPAKHHWLGQPLPLASDRWLSNRP